MVVIRYQTTYIRQITKRTVLSVKMSTSVSYSDKSQIDTLLAGIEPQRGQ